MGFDNLNTDAGIATLNTFIADKSYIEGFTASQADVAVFEAIATAPAAGKLSGVKKAASEYGPSGATTAAADEDDIDLFGSEDEDPELEKAKAERLAAYQAKKAAKGPGPAAKSSILLDVKPWDDETDMAAMEKAIRTIVMDGLLWGASQLVPIGYGIKKLQISCVVEDDKVGTDMLNDAICEFDELVQSVDVASFNKI